IGGPPRPQRAVWQGDKDKRIIQSHKWQAARRSPHPSTAIHPACYIRCTPPDAHPAPENILDESFGLRHNPAVTCADFQQHATVSCRRQTSHSQPTSSVVLEARF
ncbi:unnamed protein product, partial [Sphacelaria rigidula]